MVNRIKIKHLYVLALAVIAIQVIGSLAYFIFAQSTESVQAIYVTAKVFMFVIPLIFFIIPLKTPKAFAKKGFVTSGLLGLGFGLATFILVSGFYLLFWDLFTPFGMAIHGKIVDVGIVHHYLLAALGFSFVHSAFEEYIWRWFVFGVFRMEFSWVWAALISSAAFTLHHYIILSEFFTWPFILGFGSAVGVGGFIWCWMYERTGNITGAWIAHVFADLAIFAVGYLILTDI